MISTNTGSKSLYNAAAAVAVKVIAGTSTFFFFLKFFEAKAICKAAEQDVTPTEYLIPINLLHEFSNFFTSGPYPIQDLLNIFLIEFISSFPREGLKSLIFFFVVLLIV